MKVLVAMDGSKYGRWGLSWIAKLPFVEPPRVTVLHVLDIAAIRAPFLAQPVMVGNERYLQEEIQRMETRSAKILDEATQQLISLKLKGTACKEQGAVASAILKRMPKRNGLLVVGSKGLDALDRFMLGSVSTKIIHHATCPVLVVKGEAAPLRRIVLAIDESEASAKALEFVLTKFQPDRSSGKGGRVPIHASVIHVRISSPLAAITIKSTVPWIKSPGLKKIGSKLVEQSMQKLTKAGFTAEPMRPLGKPAEEILKEAAKQHADLIVMGAKGLNALDRFFLGSVSTRVVQHAKCAVLVVR
jgi:nucleotide-binding universal stress UspA family protein